MSGETERLKGAAGLDRAAAILRGGGTVAFPTETVYGLGANALDEVAVGRIFGAKERPAWDPLIVHVCDEEMLGKVAEVSAKAKELIGAFWPGPLTLLLPRTAAVPDVVTAGRALVGVRMPRHPLALELIRRAGVPVAAPSANRFGRTSPTTAQHVLEDLDGRINAVLDGGPTDVGVESTVLDVGAGVIYRPGGVSKEDLERVMGKVEVFRPMEMARAPESLPSPGVGIRHYAPRARLVLVGSQTLASVVEEASRDGVKVAVMLPHGWDTPSAALVYRWGDWSDGDTLARRLFAGLRELDEAGASVIVCPVPEMNGIGEAIRDRLRKAAREK